MDYNKYLYIYMKRLRTKKMMEKENLYIYIHRLGPIMLKHLKHNRWKQLETT